MSDHAHESAPTESNPSESDGTPREGRTLLQKGVAVAGGVVAASAVMELVLRPAPAYGDPRPDIPRPTGVARVSDNSAVTCEDGGKIVLWGNIDPPNTPPNNVTKDQFQKDHDKKVAYVSVAAGRVFAASFDGKVTVRDLGRPHVDPLHTLPHPATGEGDPPEVWVVIPTPDGKFALAGENTGKIVLWDVDNEVVKATFKDGDERVAALAWRPVGAPAGRMQFVSGHEDGKAVLWQFNPTANPIVGTIVRRFPHDNRDEPVNSVAVSPNGMVLVSVGFERIARVWNLTNAAPIATVEDFEDLIWRVAISPDGKKFATASQDGTVRLFRLSNGQEFPGQTGFDQQKMEQWGAMGVDFLKNTRIIYTTSNSGNDHFKTWDVPANWPPGPPPP